MSDTKDGGSKKASSSSGGDVQPEAAAPSRSPEPTLQASGIPSRPVEILIAQRDGMLHTQSTDQIAKALSAMPDVRIRKTLRPSGLAVMAAGAAGASDVIVAETSEARKNELRMTASPALIVEENLELMHLGGAITSVGSPKAAILPMAASAASAIVVQIKVQDTQGRPIGNCLVTAYGRGFVNGSTDAQGSCTLTFFGESLSGITALYVKPFADFWERWIDTPQLAANTPNTVTLEPLSAFQPAGFPGTPFVGWGQRLMGLDQQAVQRLTGQGCKVAIIDSGCDNTHPSLTHVRVGRDLTNLDQQGNPDQQSWSQDTLSHGTHCAGVISGNGQGMRGFAPQAEVHVLKLFPGGKFDDLISALAYCVDNRIDVVNCSLGSDQISETVMQRMEQARQAGVAVVVAAGNNAGPVLFPALLPSCFAVSALGQQNDYPPYTYHARTSPQQAPGLIGVNGTFAANFSCYGPQVRACAPGVAIISTVPGGGFASWDGTSMAAPHITGLCALVAAHHPAFANRAAPRNAAWVDQLFQIVVQAAAPLGLDAQRGGAGLPLATGALQQQAAPQAAQPGLVAPTGQDMDAVIRRMVYAVAQQQGLVPAFMVGQPPEPQWLARSR
jgi:subtilisin